MTIPDLTVDLLRPAVTALLGRPVTVRPGWQVRPLAHTLRNPVTAGLYQANGRAITGDPGEEREWTVVLKVLRFPSDAPAWLRADQPDQWNYWQRELLAYRTGLPASLAADLAAPRYLGAHQPDERTMWLWIEHVTGTPATAWPPERYLTAARHLALAQGLYLTGRPLPCDPWLAHDWLAAWTPSLPPKALAILDDSRAWAHPLIRDVLPPQVGEATRRLAGDRDRLLTAVARLPVTVCHHDYWPPNLLSRTDPDGRERTVALDWSWIGLDPAGLDPANLVLDATASGYLPADRLAELDHDVLDAYLDGLTETGWKDPSAPVRAGHDVTAALRFGLDAPDLLTLARNQDRHATLEERHGRPVAEIIASRAAVVRHALRLADRAASRLGTRRRTRAGLWP
ncbi:MAG: hypothetical protein ACRDYA_21100 [Egibacteraceae bacterium]